MDSVMTLGELLETVERERRARERCDFCGTLHKLTRGCYYDELLVELRGVTLTPAQDRHLRWLAGLDRPTVDAFKGILRAARAAGGSR